MVASAGGIIVASNTDVLSLVPVMLVDQLDDLVDRNNFEEALSLCNMANENEFEEAGCAREERLSLIHMRYGYFLFNQSDYQGNK